MFNRLLEHLSLKKEIGLKCVVSDANFSSKMISNHVLWYGADDKHKKKK